MPIEKYAIKKKIGSTINEIPAKYWVSGSSFYIRVAGI